MILRYDQLPEYKKKVVMVDGCFDPLHIGHIRYFQVAAEQGIPVLCNVQSDAYIQRTKERANLLPEDQRLALIQAMKGITYVHLCTNSTHEVLEQLQPLQYIKGLDWKDRGLPPIQEEICSKCGIEIVYLDTNVDTSTNIMSEFMAKTLPMKLKQNVEQFEEILFTQKAVESVHYDDHYFHGDWRDGHNDYTIETRRAIEAKNPQNIKEIFQPKTVLDVGCGPGALMYFLWELGIDPYGIDFSRAAKELAPKEIRDHITVGQVTEYHPFDTKFDLVICRELLEHLTIFQVRQTVQSLAKYTSKYLYVTTRYYPQPQGLLDITDDLETDASHITLMNKDFLKVLFMLEGLKPRYDLERKLDWKNYGRVLVFEKV
ncbi:MAG: methyltransferase domain-containing protein [Candidatus Auribacterota bacterium]